MLSKLYSSLEKKVPYVKLHNFYTSGSCLKNDGICSLIHKHGTMSYASEKLPYPLDCVIPRYTFDKGLGGPQSRYGSRGERRSTCPCWDSNPAAFLPYILKFLPSLARRYFISIFSKGFPYQDFVTCAYLASSSDILHCLFTSFP